ncbi:hypothetical protein [uncultured Maribacter sp.]|uniref:hypothetical protein n=1 Tax=uncultured Maribacter sp. TaxID=431308 RepID=UPI0030EB5E82|tara:strand:- start:112634 stop:112993 length:360 start_codon:yes stop_codon:yes gene_type:complete
MKTSKENPFKYKIRIVLIANIIVISTGLLSCNNDDGINSNSCENWSENFLSQSKAYSNASAIYSNDPSVTNCNNLKTEGLNYVNALEGVINCVPTVNLSEYNQDIKELKAEINSTNCAN